MKKVATRKSHSRKKMLLHSLHHHVKIVCRLRRRRVGINTRLHLHDGLL